MKNESKHCASTNDFSIGKYTQFNLRTRFYKGVPIRLKIPVFYQIKCTQYWPEMNKVARHGNNSVRNVEEKEYAFYVIRKLKVANKKVIPVINWRYIAWYVYAQVRIKRHFLLSFYRETLNLFPVLRFVTSVKGTGCIENNRKCTIQKNTHAKKKNTGNGGRDNK